MSYTNFPSTIFLEKHDMINNMINSIARTNMGQHKYALEVDIGFLAPGSRRMIPVEQRASIFQAATARGSLSSVLTICLRQCNPLSQHKSSRYFSCTIWFFFFFSLLPFEMVVLYQLPPLPLVTLFLKIITIITLNNLIIQLETKLFSMGFHSCPVSGACPAL